MAYHLFWLVLEGGHLPLHLLHLLICPYVDLQQILGLCLLSPWCFGVMGYSTRTGTKDAKGAKGARNTYCTLHILWLPSGERRTYRLKKSKKNNNIKPCAQSGYAYIYHAKLRYESVCIMHWAS